MMPGPHIKWYDIVYIYAIIAGALLLMPFVLLRDWITGKRDER